MPMLANRCRDIVMDGHRWDRRALSGGSRGSERIVACHPCCLVIGILLEEVDRGCLAGEALFRRQVRFEVRRCPAIGEIRRRKGRFEDAGPSWAVRWAFEIPLSLIAVFGNIKTLK